MHSFRPILRILFLTVLLAAVPALHLRALDPASDEVLSPSNQKEAQSDTAAAPVPEDTYRSAILIISVIVAGGAVFLILRSKNRLGARLSQSSRGAIDMCRVRSLGGKEYLAVIQVEGKRMLLGIGPTFITKLSDLEPEDFSIPYERKPGPEKKPDNTAPEPPATNFSFNNLITRINESLSRKDTE